MTKSAKVQARVEPELKEQVEKILNKLGMSTTDAINIFFHQIVQHEGLPFDVKISKKKGRGKENN